MKSDGVIRKLSLLLVALMLLGTLVFLLMGHDLRYSIFSTMIILLSHFKHGTEDPLIEQATTIVLILGSYLVLAYIIRGSAEYLFEGEFRERRRKRKMAKVISKMEDHFIIAGYGRVGRQIADDLHDEGVDFIVVDRSESEIAIALKNGYNAVLGDPVKEETLIQANIRSAKSLLAALGTDTDNLFLTLTAKALNPDLFIVARASEEENISKLEKAGANRVTMPYQIGGYHMAAAAIRPSVVDFLDVMTDGKHSELQVEEINVDKGSSLVGQRIGEILSRKKTGATVLAINKYDGYSRINPSGEEMIERGDQLIVMGTKDQLETIQRNLSE